MKKMSKKLTKLTIHRDTLRTLTAELNKVIGGAPIQSIEVCETYYPCTVTQGPRCMTNVVTRC